jgi:hypothetical protein
MEFNPDKVSFGRHESFPLRYPWLTRGFQEFSKDTAVFEADDATTRLGVGKNMVRAIKFWLVASKILEPVTRYSFQPSKLGTAIFSDDGWDPYLEDDATIWLIHWLLSTSPEQATVNYWFFNRFHKTLFSSTEPQSAFVDFCNEHVATRFATTTVKRDVAVLLRMYSKTPTTNRTPAEETLDSPLSALGLLSFDRASKSYISTLSRRDDLPLEVVGFALTQLFDALESKSLPVERLMYTRERFPALGSVFRLTESGLIAHLERLVQIFPDSWALRETAGLHQLFRLEKTSATAILRKRYERDEDSLEDVA